MVLWLVTLYIHLLFMRKKMIYDPCGMFQSVWHFTIFIKSDFASALQWIISKMQYCVVTLKKKNFVKGV